jgi:hypothetical protein
MSDQPIQTSLSRRSAAEPSTVVIRPAAERKANARRWVSVVRRWFRETFSREQLLSSLRSLVWVAPLTVLIWIYAEREQVDRAPAQLQVEVRSGSPGQVARLADSGGGRVIATIRGPKAKVSQAVEALQAGVPVQIFIGGGRQPGFHDIEIPALIERDPRLRDNGLSVVTCNPGMIRVEVDALREELLDVKIRPDVQPLLNGPPLFDPPKIKVTAPASAFDKAAKGAAYVEAELPQDLRTPGRHGPVAIRISVAGLTGPDVTPRQTSVNATFEVRDADERTVLNSIPVKMLITPELGDAYKVTADRKFDQGVPVYGSPEAIRQLKNGELSVKPEASFSVTSADVPAGKVTRKLEYVLPDGIHMLEQDKKTINFTITPREGAQ